MASDGYNEQHDAHQNETLTALSRMQMNGFQILMAWDHSDLGIALVISSMGAGGVSQFVARTHNVPEKSISKTTF